MAPRKGKPAKDEDDAGDGDGPPALRESLSALKEVAARLVERDLPKDSLLKLLKARAREGGGEGGGAHAKPPDTRGGEQAEHAR